MKKRRVVSTNLVGLQKVRTLIAQAGYKKSLGLPQPPFNRVHIDNEYIWTFTDESNNHKLSIGLEDDGWFLTLLKVEDKPVQIYFVYLNQKTDDEAEIISIDPKKLIEFTRNNWSQYMSNDALEIPEEPLVNDKVIHCRYKWNSEKRAFVHL